MKRKIILWLVGAVHWIRKKLGYSREYPTPVFPEKILKHRKPRKRLGAPPCIPGTITYRDALVRHLGYDRRAADKLLREWRDGPIHVELPKL